MPTSPTLFIQIPCYNEAETLPVALADLPRELPGVARVVWLVVDDGSTDDTVAVAKAHGVDHVVRHTRNMGLAKAFMTGLNACLELGADIIVNTDADNQYDAACIPDLLAPILEGRADMVVGARPIDQVEHFSPLKKRLQKFGSWVLRKVSGTEVQDAPSGFRALTRRAAMRLNVFSEYTYTLETIIQAGQARLAVVSVPVRVNGKLRPSRLMSSMVSYLRKSLATVLRISITYRPLRFFLNAAWVFFILGGVLCLRWLALYFLGTDRAHVPSLILATILLSGGFFCAVLAVLGDLLAVNRKLLEDVRYRLMRLELDHKRDAGPDADAEPDAGEAASKEPGDA
ncbi:MAG: glycosyltransferase family 2 protein [Desulfovibrionaceae bacterium]